MDFQLRDLNRRVDLSQPITIVASSAGKRHLHDLLPFFLDYTISNDDTVNYCKRLTTNILLIGNLTDNLLCEYLYQKMIVFSDKRYPGGSGYEIRLLIDPIGSGKNIIHLGYSEDEGLKNAIREFKKIIGPDNIIADISHSDSNVLPIDRHYVNMIENSKIPEEELIFSIHTSYWWLQGLLAYLGSNQQSFKNYDEGLDSFLARAEKINSLGSNMHLHMVQHVVTIWVLEHSGYFNNDKRQEIFTALFRWANSEEGIGYIRSHEITGKTVCHNHTLFCALALKILSELFSRRCGKNSIYKEWDEAADLCFSSFNRGGWKPLCDDSAYSVEVTLVLVSVYSLFEDEHRFLNNGGQNALAWLKTVIGNDGFMPSFGDGTTYNPTATVLMKLFSYWYRDKELIHILNKLPDDIRYKISVLCHHNYEIGLQEEPNDENKVRVDVIKPDAEIFDCFLNSEAEARNILDRKPSYPIEVCFDKLSVRNKDFRLLVDGLSSPYTHAYHDGGGLLDFTMNGVTWLVEENCYRWPETEHCNMITITRDGSFTEPAPFAKLLKTKEYEDGMYIAIEIDDYNGCLWQREYILAYQAGLIIRDHVTVKETDDYTICFHVKTPSVGILKDQEFIVERKDSSGNAHAMIIRDIDKLEKTTEIIKTGEKLFMCGDSGKEVEIYNHGSFSAEMGIKAWGCKYHDESISVTRLETRISGRYMKNEKKVMTHLFMIDGSFEATVDGEQLEITGHGRKSIYNVINGEDRIHESIQVSKTECDNEHLLTKLIDGITVKDGVVINDVVILMTNENTLTFFSENKEIREVRVHENMTCICVFKGQVAVGTDTGLIKYYDVSGNLIREKRLIRIPSIFATWETSRFEVTSLAQVTDEEQQYLAVGTGDNQIKLINETGDILFSSYIYATIPDKIFCFDIENDGSNEIITIGSESMNAGCVYNFKFDGKDNSYPRIGGWLNNIIDISWNDQYMICGLKYGDNLIMMKRNQDFDVVFRKNLGGKVNGVLISFSKVYAVTSKGYLLSYTMDGHREKMIDLGSVAYAIKRIGEFLMVETIKGVTVLDSELTIKDHYEGCRILSEDYLYDTKSLFRMNGF